MTATSQFPFASRDHENIAWYPLNFREISEEEIWANQRTTQAQGIYVHVPFCKFTCPFCHFNRSLWTPYSQEIYLSAVKREMDLYSSFPNTGEIEAVYLGGGSPTALSDEALLAILSYLKEKFQLAGSAEITVEVHPLTARPSTLLRLRELGVNRVSMGIQTLCERMLRVLGCPHTVDDATRGIKAVKKSGIENVSIDLIYATPTETIEDWKQDLKLLLGCEPSHVACYPLAVVPGTALDESIQRGSIPPKSADSLEIEMFKHARTWLGLNDFQQYTIFNFAKRGKESAYIRIAQEAPQREYLGLGPGAFEYVNEFVSCKVPSLEQYAEALKHGNIPYLMGVHLSKLDKMSRYMVLGVKCLRVNKVEFRKIFGMDIVDVYGDAIEELKRWNLIVEDPSSIALTQDGMIYINNIAKMFYTEQNRALRQPSEMRLEEFNAQLRKDS